jgi:hypothetical protein
MKEFHRNLLVLFGFAVALLFGLQLGSAQQAGRTQWEYKSVELGNVHSDPEMQWTHILNTEGNLGWEAVSISFTAHNGNSSRCYAFMKRPKN